MTLGDILSSYSATARLLPVLLLFGPVYTFVISVTGVDSDPFIIYWSVVILPVLFLAMQWVRRKGKALESQWWEAEKGMPRLQDLFKSEMSSDKLKSLGLDTERIGQLKQKHGDLTADRLMILTRDTDAYPVVNSELKIYGFVRNALSIRSYYCWSLALQIIICLIFMLGRWCCYAGSLSTTSPLCDYLAISSLPMIIAQCLFASGALTYILSEVTEESFQRAQYNYAKSIIRAGVESL